MLKLGHDVQGAEQHPAAILSLLCCLTQKKAGPSAAHLDQNTLIFTPKIRRTFKGHIQQKHPILFVLSEKFGHKLLCRG